MEEIRIFHNPEDNTTTIVLVGVPEEKVQKIATEIVGVSIETVSTLKGNGFNTEMPAVVEPVAEAKTPAPVSLNTDNLFDEQKPVKAETEPSTGEIVTNPIPEDEPIATSLLTAPVKETPSLPVSMDEDIMPKPDATEEADEMPVEEFVFGFGVFRNKSIKQSLESDPAKAFGYFKWLLAGHILANKNPNEDVFKKDVIRQLRNYFKDTAPQEAELADVAYVLLASSDAATRDDILSIFGYADLDEFYESKNETNYADACKMLLA